MIVTLNAHLKALARERGQLEKIEKLKEELEDMREKMISLCHSVCQGYNQVALKDATEFLAHLDSWGGYNKI